MCVDSNFALYQVTARAISVIGPHPCLSTDADPNRNHLLRGDNGCSRCYRKNRDLRNPVRYKPSLRCHRGALANDAAEPNPKLPIRSCAPRIDARATGGNQCWTLREHEPERRAGLDPIRQSTNQVGKISQRAGTKTAKEVNAPDSKRPSLAATGLFRRVSSYSLSGLYSQSNAEYDSAHGRSTIPARENNCCAPKETSRPPLPPLPEFQLGCSTGYIHFSSSVSLTPWIKRHNECSPVRCSDMQSLREHALYQCRSAGSTSSKGSDLNGRSRFPISPGGGTFSRDLPKTAEA